MFTPLRQIASPVFLRCLFTCGALALSACGDDSSEQGVSADGGETASSDAAAQGSSESSSTDAGWADDPETGEVSDDESSASDDQSDGSQDAGSTANPSTSGDASLPANTDASTPPNEGDAAASVSDSSVSAPEVGGDAAAPSTVDASPPATDDAAADAAVGACGAEGDPCCGIAGGFGGGFGGGFAGGDEDACESGLQCTGRLLNRTCEVLGAADDAGAFGANCGGEGERCCEDEVCNDGLSCDDPPGRQLFNSECVAD
jgi:hypothetical protein